MGVLVLISFFKIRLPLSWMNEHALLVVHFLTNITNDMFCEKVSLFWILDFGFRN